MGGRRSGLSLLELEDKRKEFENQNTIARFPAKTNNVNPIVSGKDGTCSIVTALKLARARSELFSSYKIWQKHRIGEMIA